MKAVEEYPRKGDKELLRKRELEKFSNFVIINTIF